MVRSKNTGAVSSSLLKNSFYSPFRSKRKISFRRKPNKKRDSSDNVGPRNGRLGLFQQAARTIRSARLSPFTIVMLARAKRTSVIRQANISSNGGGDFLEIAAPAEILS